MLIAWHRGAFKCFCLYDTCYNFRDILPQTLRLYNTESFIPSNSRTTPSVDLVIMILLCLMVCCQIGEKSLIG